ncbi:MAG: NAD-dependent epimerase/dehydratase family protein [Rhodothermaceae bacterium]|nr:NAD-dependent epimerase/dehydratase family protein [Rhodothermaceae bacterium]
MHTILGSGGAIGLELAKALPQYTRSIRLVSRNPKAVNSDDELHPADLTNRESVLRAVEGSEVVYVTVGFAYNIKVWQETWPPFMRNVIEACNTHNAKLVFFDNIYMYDPTQVGNMKEHTPVGPTSKKGKVREQVANMVLDAIQSGKIEALIARSADFYGPGIKNTSVLTETVFNTLHAGKKANWLGNLRYKHSYTYTPDAGKATAMLGTSYDAFGHVWHLPTAPNPPTGKEWIEMIAKELGVEPKVQVANKFMVRILGLFMPIMKEMVEMMYQYENDYVFDSSRFEQKFKMKPTPYADGVKEIVAQDYQ